MNTAKLLVLVVHPDAVVAGALAAVLGRAGFDVTRTTDGAEAIAELHGAEFDVAVVDLGLSGRSGIDVLRVARILSPDTEVIVTTRTADLELAVTCLREGAFDFFHEELDVERVASCVGRAAERRRSRTTAALYAACSRIGGKTSPREVAEELVAIAASALEADVAILADAPSGPTSRVLCSPAEESSSEDIRAFVDGVLAACPSRALLYPAEVGSEDTVAVLARTFGIRSAVIHPLVADGQLAGVLIALRTSDPRRFKHADVERADVVAGPLVLALENERLLARMLTSERLAAVGELAAGIAHEVNNPLSYVMANHECLVDMVGQIEGVVAALPPDASAERLRRIAFDVRESLSEATEGAQRIAEISGDLRSLARGASAPEDVFDVSDSARSALRIAAAKLRSSASVVVDLAPELFVRGRGGRLCQVFVNLFVNAAQAACDAHERVEVFVSTRREGDRIVAVVRDTGPGIRPEHMPHLFDAFFSTKPAGSGTGLGLPLSRRIVEEMGGTLRVTSEIGAGASFIIDLPFAPADAGADDHQCPAPASGRRLRLLCVDDDIAVLRMYERCFGREADVVTVTTVEQALAAIEGTAAFDVIITDVVMCGQGGLDFYEALADRPAIVNRLLFATGSAHDPCYAQALADTGRPILEKPIDMHAIRDFVHAIATAGDLYAAAG